MTKSLVMTYPTFAEGYKLLECVGKGSEGSVWRALCIPMKKEVAIKIIDLESMPTSALEELREQIHLMYLCSMHPHVVRYYTSFVNAGSLWCVMKYLSGGSCSDILRCAHTRGLDEAAIKIILKDVLKALEYLHANGRIHRDIKAGNIVISKTGRVQVADFGVSGSVVEQLRTTLCGSPCWMAPEVMLRAWPGSKASGYDDSVDIWSLGITALELAKGRPPLADCAPSRVFSLVVKNPPPALEDVEKRKFSSHFKDFVSLCLQKDPSKRPSASRLLKHKFFKGKKSRDYLVSAVLSQVPPAEERLPLPSESPVIHSHGPNENGNWWDFEADAVEPGEASCLSSFESTSNLLNTSVSSPALSLGTGLSRGSSYYDEDEFFHDWFDAPTPANTLHQEDFATEEFTLALTSSLGTIKHCEAH
eukprot:Phypoly_transcript_05880.p1 GENE.Phypoly_transcript_05880~~Phypoly_transcript_05880.p1  ORF type:complete len:419 (+),score=59.78 Phypoly_transcript_05880:371-1627(+)